MPVGSLGTANPTHHRLQSHDVSNVVALHIASRRPPVLPMCIVWTVTEAKPVRWTASVAVEWSPILTYARRRQEFLDWAEANCDIAGFLDKGEFLGLAIGGRGQRIEITRRGLELQIDDPRMDVAALSRPLEGIAEIFQPTGSVVTAYRGRWSVQLEDEYEDVAHRVARAAVPLSQGPAPIDVALLVDLDHAQAMQVQMEYGIVDLEQLTDRLTREDSGRSLAPSSSLDSAVVVGPLSLRAALFADVYWDPAGWLASGEPGALLGGLEATESLITDMLRELASKL